MTTRSKPSKEATGNDRPQNRVWFWIAAALIPEAACFHVESSRAMAQRAELLREMEARQLAAAESRKAA